MKYIQYFGLILFVLALMTFTAMLGIGKVTLNADNITVEDKHQHHKDQIIKAAKDAGLFDTPTSNVAFISKYKSVINTAAAAIETQAETSLPEGVPKWEYTIQKWQKNNYISEAVSKGGSGPVKDNPLTFLFLTFGTYLVP